MTSGLVVRNNPSGIADKTLQQSCVSRLNCSSSAQRIALHFQEVLIHGLIAHTLSEFMGWRETSLPYFINGDTQTQEEVPAELSHVAVKLVPAFDEGCLKTTQNISLRKMQNFHPVCDYAHIYSFS